MVEGEEGEMATSCEVSPGDDRALSVPRFSDDETTQHPVSGRRVLALALKRLVDIAGSLTLLIVAAPVFPLIALAIRLESAGPIFFRPRVIGYKGREFLAYKFRSMQANAYERLLKDPSLMREYKENLKIADDPRITRVGRVLRRTSLDELPQLINVLFGEMSLVGPRFLSKIELEKFGEHRDKILSVKPGMAGLWVASGRQSLSFERRLALELQYVSDWSLWLDLKCFCKTILIAVRMVGAN
jgi:lipopolysaccharide/colanic/teichoic acid biosynthesis glycosyltransferase